MVSGLRLSPSLIETDTQPARPRPKPARTTRLPAGEMIHAIHQDSETASAPAGASGAATGAGFSFGFGFALASAASAASSARAAAASAAVLDARRNASEAFASAAARSPSAWGVSGVQE